MQHDKRGAWAASAARATICASPELARAHDGTGSSRRAPPDASALMGPRHVGFSCRFLQSPDIENCLLGSTLSGLFSSILEPSFDLRPAIADPTFRQANTRWRAPSAELSTQCVLGVPERLGSISLSQHAIWAQPACSRRPRRGPARGASKSLATAVVCAHGLNDESLSMRMHQC
jgi:hypothetical protein